MNARSTWPAGFCLLAVIGGMLWLGAVADVLPWFAVQLTPAGLVLALAVLRSPLGVYGAPAVLLFWLLMLVLLAIWLTAGSAHHPWWEMVLTAVVGGVCASGVTLSLRAARGAGAARRRLGFAAFAAYQIGAFFVSIPYFDSTAV